MVPIFVERSIRPAPSQPVNSAGASEQGPADGEASFASHLREPDSTPEARETQKSERKEEVRENEERPDKEPFPEPRGGDSHETPSKAENVPVQPEAAPAPVVDEAIVDEIVTDFESTKAGLELKTDPKADVAPKTKTGNAALQRVKPSVASVETKGPQNPAEPALRKEEPGLVRGSDLPADVPAEEVKDAATAIAKPAIVVESPKSATRGEVKAKAPEPVEMTVTDVGAAEDKTTGKDEAGDASGLAVAEAAKNLGEEPRKAKVEDVQVSDAGEKVARSVEPAVAAVAAPTMPAADASSASGDSEELTRAVSEDRRIDGSRDAEVPSRPSSGDEQVSDATSSKFGQHLVSHQSERSQGSVSLSDMDQSRLIDRVARAVRYAEGRDGLVRLRLHPPELGSVRLELRLQGGALTARLEADTSQARSVLVENLPALRERLSEQGVRIEQFDVDLRDRQNGQNPNPGDQRGQRDSDSRQTRLREATAVADLQPLMTNAPASSASGLRRLDVKV